MTCHCRGEHVCQPGTEQDMIEPRRREPMKSRTMTAFRDLPLDDQCVVVLHAILLKNGIDSDDDTFSLTMKEIERAFDNERDVYVETRHNGVILKLKKRDNGGGST